ncbi:MAG: DUF2238 domain-containing protein [Phycisphaerales bacterium]|jgi:uncharacterized membrane protein YjdF
MGNSESPFLRDRTRLIAAISFGVALTCFSVYAILRGNAEFIFYGVVLVILAVAVFMLDRRVGLSHAAIWGLLVWAVLHLAGGNVPAGEAGVLYNFRPAEWLPKYDQALHAFGFAVATLVCWECLRRALVRDDGAPPRATTGLAIACVLMGIGLGALNEVVEFIAVLTMPETNVGGYMNTGWDLVSNLTGAAAMGVWIRLRG